MVYESVRVDIDYVSIDNAIKELQEARETLIRRGVTGEISVDIEHNHDGDCTLKVIVSGQRPETEKEKEAQAQKERESKEARRKYFEKLKKEFEGTP